MVPWREGADVNSLADDITAAGRLMRWVPTMKPADRRKTARDIITILRRAIDELSRHASDE